MPKKRDVEVDTFTFMERSMGRPKMGWFEDIASRPVREPELDKAWKASGDMWATPARPAPGPVRRTKA